MSQPSESKLPVPLSCQVCPICGGPNGCKPARTGSHEGEPCWCTAVKFSRELLARVPVAQQGQACICQRCATHNGFIQADQ